MRRTAGNIKQQKKSEYRIAFMNEGKVYEVYARSVSQAGLMGFVEVEGLLFGEKSSVVVDPSEERLRTEFAQVERFFVPLHAVVRIDQVAKRGTARITAGEGGDKVRALPTPLLVPGKRES
jgi:hypothetical protein